MKILAHEQEGVIKYHLQHQYAGLDTGIDLAEINAWRAIMHRLGLIGQHPAKYAGLGYGNISCRHAGDSFIISGTQTGHLAHLQREQFCLVQSADAQHNTLVSLGVCQPSSEALTHAVVYQTLASVNCVIHVHCPEIWRHAEVLQLPATAATIRYGTPEMAHAVCALLRQPHCLNRQLFAMQGHEDGVVAFGTGAAATAQRLIACLADAFVIAG